MMSRNVLHIYLYPGYILQCSSRVLTFIQCIIRSRCVSWTLIFVYCMNVRIVTLFWLSTDTVGGRRWHSASCTNQYLCNYEPWRAFVVCSPPRVVFCEHIQELNAIYICLGLCTEHQPRNGRPLIWFPSLPPSPYTPSSHARTVAIRPSQPGPEPVEEPIGDRGGRSLGRRRRWEFGEDNSHPSAKLRLTE